MGNNADSLKILMITRKFPPSIGGMERMAYKLFVHLSKISRVEIVKWGGSKRYLPIVLPFMFIKSIWILLRRDINLIYIQDAFLAPMGLLLKLIFRKPVVATVHALDITYKNRIYQLIIPKCLRKLDRVIAVSSAIAEICLSRGVSKDKISVIPNGISDDFYIEESKDKIKRKLGDLINLNLENKKIILSVGRLVEKKGFHWFIESVLPKMVKTEKDIVYLIAGDGPLKNKIRESIEKSRMEKYVFLLGKVSDEMLKLLYNSADVFVMPNIQVEGDIEGFGIVALEAGSCGISVVASNLGGLKDAVIPYKNGFLVEAYDVDGFINTISEILRNQDKKFREEIREFTLKNFGWESIAMRYLELFSSLLCP